MEHFLVNPNYITISKYLTFPDPIESYQGSWEFVIESYYNKQNELKFSGDHIAVVEKGFLSILNEFGIGEHYDNLLFLALNKRVEIDGAITYYHDSYEYRKRSKELAKLLLAFKESGERHFTSLILKTLTDTVKVTEPQLMTWICSLIESSIKAGDVPYYILGLEDMQMNNETELKAKADQPLTLPPKNFSKYLADFCFYMHLYLVNETSLKPNQGTLLSDDLCNFYFQTLVLFEMIHPDQIDSEPKDYIGAILRNQIKRLNIR